MGKPDLTVLMRVKTGENAAARGAAGCLRHETVFETDAFLGQLVHVDRPGARVAVAAELDPEVVGGNQQDVGTPARQSISAAVKTTG